TRAGRPPPAHLYRGGGPGAPYLGASTLRRRICGVTLAEGVRWRRCGSHHAVDLPGGVPARRCTAASEPVGSGIDRPDDHPIRHRRAEAALAAEDPVL